MNRLHWKLLLFIISVSLITGSMQFAVAEDNGNVTEGIKTAIIRSLCYDVYWAGGWGSGEDYRRGEALPLKLLIEGETFYARIDPIGFFGKNKQPMRAERIGIVRSDQAVVVANSMYGSMDELFATKPIIKDTITIPTDCTPHYDPPTPQKELMLQTVISTMQKQLSDFVRLGIWKYKGEVTLIISDFNIDYPSAYILVEQTKDVFSVTLHDPQNYDSEEYEQTGEYPFGQVYNTSKSLLIKIRKHGIVRKIVLTP